MVNGRFYREKCAPRRVLSLSDHARPAPSQSRLCWLPARPIPHSAFRIPHYFRGSATCHARRPYQEIVHCQPVCGRDSALRCPRRVERRNRVWSDVPLQKFRPLYGRGHRSAMSLPGLKHFRFAEEAGGASRLGGSWRNDLRCAMAIVAAHGKGVVPMLEGPVITPEHPGQTR